MDPSEKIVPLIVQAKTPSIVASGCRPSERRVQNDEKSNQVLLPTAIRTPPEEKVFIFTFWNSYGGMLMALSASLFFSVAFLMIKTLEKDGVGSFGSALLFNLGVLLPCSVGIVFNEYGPCWKKRERVLQDLWPIDSKERKITLGILAVSICKGA